MKKAVCITSGGGDSIANGLMLLKDGYHVIFLHVSHGQKCAEGEKAACQAITDELLRKGYSCSLKVIDAKWLGDLGTSGLTDSDIDVPEGLEGVYGSTIQKIFTPNRNSVLLGIAGAVAEAERVEVITLGACQSEAAYPDNTKEYLDAYTNVLRYSCYHAHPIAYSPIWNLDKVEIYKWAFNNDFGVIHSSLTWSCDDVPMVLDSSGTRNSMLPCGRCGCCRNRRMVFHILNHLYPGQGCYDLEQYADMAWFTTIFLPTIKENGIPANKWFSKYAEVLKCKIV